MDGLACLCLPNVPSGLQGWSGTPVQTWSDADNSLGHGIAISGNAIVILTSNKLLIMRRTAQGKLACMGVCVYGCMCVCVLWAYMRVCAYVFIWCVHGCMVMYAYERMGVCV